MASLPALAFGLREGSLDARDFLTLLAERFEALEDQVKAFIPEPDRFERLGRDLAALDKEFPDPIRRPPLYAVPVGIKDIFRADGFPTRAGSRVPPELLAGPEATVVSRLRAAGALLLGKTVTTEFAYFAPGPTRNPAALDHTPGGSSSGSAAAVAAGLAPLAIGTQTIGSVNRPAAFCGVVGLKPSYGRIPMDGVIPLAPSLDHVGLFTGDLVGATFAATFLVDDWRMALANPIPGSKPTLGVPTEGAYLACASEAARAHLESVVARLEAQGFTVRRLAAFDDFAAIRQRHDTLVAAEAARVHARWYANHRRRYHIKTAELIERGQAVTDRALPKLRASRLALRSRLEAAMDAHGVDLWLTPAATGPAPEGLESTGDPVMNLPFTHAGMPTLSLPAGSDDEDLPLGIQLAGRFGDDERLLARSASLETALREVPAA